MRERRSSDWVVDLNGRHGFEAQVESELVRHRELRLLRSSTNSFDKLDFQLVGPADRLVQLELKAKHQPLSDGWRQLRPDIDPADLFVLDELALRKIVDAGRYAFLLVRDVPEARWTLWSTGDLLVASRVRHARRLDRSPSPRWKGKLLFNLAEAAYITSSVRAALDELLATTSRLEQQWSDIAPWPAAGGER